MIKRLNSKSIYDVITERGTYKVLLSPLKNTSSGQPRFEATIIAMNINGEPNGLYNAVYKFTGHYLGDYGECEWIVKHYEEEIKSA